MKEVIVETIGKGIRTIQVGITLNKIKSRSLPKIEGLIHSPLIFPYTGSNSKPSDVRCWKTTKNGIPKPKKGWQRHPTGLYSRRKKWGKQRGLSYPSVRNLNKMGLCIYPRIGG